MKGRENAGAGPGPAGLLVRLLNPALVILATFVSFFLLEAYFTQTDRFVYSSEAQRALDVRLSVIYIICGVLIYFVVALIYEKPIHSALSAIRRGEKPPEQLLSLTVLIHYRSPNVFSLTRWSSLIQPGFHVPRPTRDTNYN